MRNDCKGDGECGGETVVFIVGTYFLAGMKKIVLFKIEGN